MAIQDRDLGAALFAASTTDEIIPALVHVEYRRLHPGQDYRGEYPTEAMICAAVNQGMVRYSDEPEPPVWLPDPTVAQREAGEALAMLRDDAMAAWWESTVIGGRYFLTGVLQTASVPFATTEPSSLAPAPEGAIVADLDGLSIEGTSMVVVPMLFPDVHVAWLAAREAGRSLRHPLAPLVRVWIEAMPIEVRPDRREIGIMPGFAGEQLAPGIIVAADSAHVPDCGRLALVPARTDGQLWLPDLDPQSTQPEIEAVLLAMLDAGSLAIRSPSTPLRDRAFVESLMLAELCDRPRGERFVIPRLTIADPMAWFGWSANRYKPSIPEYGPALRRALTAAAGIEIPLSGGGWLNPVFFEAAEGLRLHSRLVASIRLMPGSERGAAVNRRVLRQAAKVSAVAWRLYLAFCFAWSRIARRGVVPYLTRPEVLRDSRGRLTNAAGTLLTGPDPILPTRERRKVPADRPATDWRDSRAVETGKREPNKIGEGLHRVYDGPGDLVRKAFPLGTRGAEKNPTRTERQTIRAARWLAGEVDMNRQRIAAPGILIVRIGRATTTGNPHGFPWRIVPPNRG